MVSLVVWLGAGWGWRFAPARSRFRLAGAGGPFWVPLPWCWVCSVGRFCRCFSSSSREQVRDCKASWPLQEESIEAVQKAIREAEALEATARTIARGGPLTFAQPLNLDSAAAATAPVLQQKKQERSAGGASARMSRQRGRGAAADVEEEADPPVKTEVKTEDPVKAEEAKQRIPSWPQMLTEEMRKRSSVVAGTSSDDLPPQADEAKPDEAEQQPDAEADEAEPAAEVVKEVKPDDVKRSARLAAARKPR